MNKRLAIIGKGTAGCLALIHFLRWSDFEITWYYDPNTKAQAVGEGSQINLPKMLSDCADINFLNWSKIDGNFKTGIMYQNWGKQDYFHNFLPPSLGMHFNAVKLQNYIHDNFSNKVKTHEGHISHDDIDADFIFDCSGKPNDLSDFTIPEFISVNSVYVTQCYWDKPQFNYTITRAMPNGWCFGIPLQNRCSIGYLYNNEITQLETIKEEVQDVFLDNNLTPSQDTNAFSFKNYYRKQNFVDRVVYGGNASFFLEPMEATSILTMERTQEWAFDYFYGNLNQDHANFLYNQWQLESEQIIMMHYAAGSKWKNDFWTYAQSRGNSCITEASKSEKWQHFVSASKSYKYGDYNGNEYGGGWAYHSFKENLEGLGLDA